MNALHWRPVGAGETHFENRLRPHQFLLPELLKVLASDADNSVNRAELCRLLVMWSEILELHGQAQQ